MTTATRSRKRTPRTSSLRFERRRADRQKATDIVPVAFRDNDELGAGISFTRLTLVDQSATGFGAVSDRPLPIGAVLTMKARGGVGVCVPIQAVRCVRCGAEYRIGLRLCSTCGGHAA